MGSFPPLGRLTALQEDLLTSFFSRDGRTFLTDGAALAGFHLGHRATDDLDLFAFPGEDLDDLQRAFSASSQSCGASVRVMQAYPDFRRLVVERGPPIERKKVIGSEVRLDSMREIAANKISALVPHAEIRDLVDLRALLAAGIDLERACDDALVKDGGADPATLAWLLDSLTIAPDARLPAGVPPEELRAFRDALVQRLRVVAFARART
jgi:hypothetical protein